MARSTPARSRTALSSSASSTPAAAAGATASSSAAATASPNMVSFPTLDLLLLTFNCAKSPIHVPVFAAHLERALADHGAAAANTSSSALPDLVVFSLQEVAPLGHAFVGSYFLAPYLSRFEQALSEAAIRVDAGYQPFDSDDDEEDEDEAGAATTTQAPSTGTTEQGRGGSGGSTAGAGAPLIRQQAKQHKPYHLVRQAHVGMTAILLFARDPATIHNIQVAECGFGVADMANKGAVGVRISYGPPPSADGSHSGDSTSSLSELTFVATHLAPMEWNLSRRNANWRSIVASLTFGNPKDVVTAYGGGASSTLGRGLQGRTHDEAASAPRTPEEEAEAAAADAAGDDAWLLLDQQDNQATTTGEPVTPTTPDTPATPTTPGGGSGSGGDLRRRLHEISVFRPSSLLFVAGDLNYRISDTSPPAGAELPGPTTWQTFLDRDQLTRERLAGRTLHGMREAPIAFPPTYKYDILSASEAESATNVDEIQAFEAAVAERGAGTVDASSPGSAPSSDEIPPVPWKYAIHRWPSWCDRVLYQDVPAWTKRRWAQKQAEAASLQRRTRSKKNTEPPPPPAVKVQAYNSLPLMLSSDHQPVYFRAQVPLLGDEEGAGIDVEDAAGEPEEYEEAESAAAAVATSSSGSTSRDTGASTSSPKDDSKDFAPSGRAVDPRIHLPVPIDTDAWDRRVQARRREWVAGGGMLLFNTRGGAVAMATAVFGMVGAYWLYAGPV